MRSTWSSFGPDDDKFITTYFRKSFSVADRVSKVQSALATCCATTGGCLSQRRRSLSQTTCPAVGSHQLVRGHRSNRFESATINARVPALRRASNVHRRRDSPGRMPTHRHQLRLRAQGDGQSSAEQSCPRRGEQGIGSTGAPRSSTFSSGVYT
jgi:hypothetical protein